MGRRESELTTKVIERNIFSSFSLSLKYL